MSVWDERSGAGGGDQTARELKERREGYHTIGRGYSEQVHPGTRDECEKCKRLGEQFFRVHGYFPRRLNV